MEVSSALRDALYLYPGDMSGVRQAVLAGELSPDASCDGCPLLFLAALVRATVAARLFVHKTAAILTHAHTQSTERKTLHNFY